MYRVKGADQKEYGPVSPDQIEQWIRENRLNRYSLVQKDGEPAWKPLDQFPEFATALGTVPAPNPPGATPPPVPGTQPITGSSSSPIPVFTPVADPLRAAGMVKGPALALLILAILGIVMSLAGVVAKPRMMELVSSANLQLPPQQLELIRGQLGKGVGVSDYANLAVGIVLYGIMIAGALKMQRLENWGLAMAAAIIAMLPCTCCCCVGIPLGIWAVLVLNRPEVKSAFR